VGVCRVHGDAAVALQPFGVGEGDAGHTRPVPARVDPDEKPSLSVVAVILPVESLHHLHRLRVVEEGVDYPEPFRQITSEGELFVESDHLPGKCLHHAISFL